MNERRDTGPAGAGAAPPFLTESQIRKLRIAVIAMGAVLLLGFAVVIGRIVQLMSRVPSAADAIAVPPSVQAPSEIKLALPQGAVVRTLSLAGNRLAVHFESPSASGVAIVDLATGRTVHTIEFVGAAR